MIINVVIDTIFWAAQHWQEITMFSLINFTAIALAKRITARKIKALFGFETRAEIREFLVNQKRIEKKLDHIYKEGGKEWPADILKLSNKSTAPTLSKHFTLLRTGKYTARSTKQHTNGRVVKMNKMKSRKFWLAVISAVLIILNDGLNIGIDQEAVFAFAGVIMSFIFGEAYVDGKKKDKDDGGNLYR